MNVLSELEAELDGLTLEETAELDRLLADELKRKWLPNPGPQTDAYYSHADVILYGGAAGGGKTDLLLGLALAEHKRSLIFRRAYVDLRGVEERLIEINGSRDGYNGHDMVFRQGKRVLEFGALDKPGSEQSWQGRPHDFIGFDEGAQLSADKVDFVMGWLRSTDPKQRCRVVIASNPPMGGDGGWLLEWFAPWLDPLHSNPAVAGEIRWAITKDKETVWVDGPGVYTFNDEEYTALSRTFVPALLEDNPYLADTNYRSRLQNLPEPLRSQLLKGDFLAGREDHEWQIIPSEWVRLAQERWKAAPQRKRRMICLSGDIALGGHDNVALAPLYEDAWFGPLITRKGAEMRDPRDIATLMVQSQRDGADLSVDGTGGWGSGVVSALKNDHQIPCESLIYSAASYARSRDGSFGFHNLRAQFWWQFREALDPEEGDNLMLPPNERLAAQLCAPRYRVKGTNILVEEKDEIRKRLGSSTDEADAVVQARYRLPIALKNRLKAAQPSEREFTQLGSGVGSFAGWMGV